jgi:hypothetical protein
MASALIGIGNELNLRKYHLTGGAFPSSYTPNYPTGLSYTTGLLGWYDSSQPSSIVKDGSNNVSQWNNLFNGATQGATVLPNFTIDPTGTSATYVTGQNYITGQSSGSKSGIYFDGASSLLSITGLASRMNLNDYAIFVVTKNFSTNQSVALTGSQIALVDKQNNNYESLGLKVGYNPYNSFFLNLDGSQISTGAVNPLGVIAYAFQGVKGGNNITSAYLFAQDYSNYSLYPYQDLNGTSTDLPWDQISIGGNVGAGDFQQSLIGEILVYNMNAVQQGSGKANVVTILTYLTNKWK